MLCTRMQSHWDKVYSLKALDEVSWYEQTPALSLEIIEKNTKSKDDAILDIGGGDSMLGECLLRGGYTNITVLDISEEALKRAKDRLGGDADRIKWVVSDMLKYEPEQEFSVIHDRAAFHFLVGEGKTAQYASIVAGGLAQEGTFVVGTFSTEGPTSCSGLGIQ